METYQINTGPDATAFHAAHCRFEDILADDSLAEAWDTRNRRDDYPVQSAEYWQFVAGAVTAFTISRDSRHLDSLTKEALLLIGHTPAMIHTEQKKAQGWAPVEHAHFLLAYGGLLQQFAAAHPDTSVTNFQWYLTESSQTVMADDPVTHHAHARIYSSLTGIRNELAATQALHKRYERTGLRWRRATPDEDIHQGFDFVAEAETSDDYYEGDIYLDVKSSATGIEDCGATDKPYIVKPNGVIALTLGLTAADFRDRFFIPAALAAQKDLELEAIFKEVSAGRVAA